MKRYCLKEQPPFLFPRKFFRGPRPEAKPEHKRIEMPSSFRSEDGSGSNGNDIGSSSCKCITRRIYNDEATRDELFGEFRAVLDLECQVRDEEELNNSADRSPLHDAVRADNEEMVESLLRNEADVDAEGKYHLTPLHIAAYRGKARIAEILLNRGASVDSECTLEGQSFGPLDLAIIGGHANLMKLLRSHGSKNRPMPNHDRRSPKDVSMDKNNVMNVYVLMSHLDETNENRKSSLLDAADASLVEYNDIVCYLHRARFISRTCLHNTDSIVILRLLIHRAVERGYVKVVEDLLIWGAEIGIIDCTRYGYHIADFTLLHNAVMYGRYKIARLLIDHGANVNAEDTTGRTSFSYAFERSNVKFLDLLLRNGAREKEESAFLLNAVTTPKSSEVIEVLLRNGLCVDSRDELDRTPLHLAVESRKRFKGHSSERVPVEEENTEEYTNVDVNVVKLLLRYGADVSARDYYFKTPLHVAAQTGNLASVKILLEHYAEVRGSFADIDATNGVGASALILAAETNHETIVKILLNHGADINFKREDGKTALIRATEKRHIDVVKFLLECHAIDIDATDSSGSTVIDIAFQRFSLFNAVCYSRIILLLLWHGADVTAINTVHSSTCTDGRMPKVLQEEIIKLKAANMRLDEKKFERIINSPALRWYREACEEEIERMKRKKICNSNVSVYDIMTKDPDRLAFVCRNRQIVKTVEAMNYKYAFPNYYRAIENNFSRGLRRRILLDQALCSFSRLIGYEVLDELSADMLIYLCNEDLKNLAEASML